MAKQSEVAPGTIATFDDPKGEVAIEARPASGDKKRFKVTHNGVEHIQHAIDSREAWALVCDGQKSWPSPKTGKVVEVDKAGNPVPVPAAAA
jgi:hypothetical protein